MNGLQNIELWDDMVERQKQERIYAIKSLNEKRYTQTEVTAILGITKTHLNNFIKRNNIVWKQKYISK